MRWIVNASEARMRALVPSQTVLPSSSCRHSASSTPCVALNARAWFRRPCPWGWNSMPRDRASARLFCTAASTNGHDSASAAACASRSGASMIRFARPSARPSSWLRAVEASWRWASGGVLTAKAWTTGSAKTITGSSAGAGSSWCCTAGRQWVARAPRCRARRLKRPAWGRPTSTAAVTPVATTTMVSRAPNRSSVTTESASVAARMAGRRNRPMSANTTPRGPISCSRERLVQAPEKRRDTLAAADAHRHDAPLRLPPLELIGQLDGQDGAGGANRVAEGDRTAVWIDLLRIDLQLPDHRDGLRREGLVQLHEIDVVDAHPDFLEQGLNGENRGNPHDLRGDPGNGVGDPFELWADTELSSLGPGHHDDGGAGIVDARRVARRHTAALAEGRLEAAERLDGRRRARMLVDLGHDRLAFLLWNRDRHDLVFEPTLGNSGGRPPLALRRQLVLGLTGDTVAIGHLLRGRAHLVATKRVRDQRQGTVDQRGLTKAPPDLRAWQEGRTGPPRL